MGNRYFICSTRSILTNSKVQICNRILKLILKPNGAFISVENQYLHSYVSISYVITDQQVVTNLAVQTGIKHSSVLEEVAPH